MLCCFFIKLPFKGLGATAGKVRAVAFDTVWGLARICLCGRPKEGGRNTKAKLAIKQKSRGSEPSINDRRGLSCGVAKGNVTD